MAIKTETQNIFYSARLFRILSICKNNRNNNLSYAGSNFAKFISLSPEKFQIDLITTYWKKAENRSGAMF